MLRPIRLISVLVTVAVIGVGGWKAVSGLSSVGAASSAAREAQLRGDSSDSYFRTANLAAALRLIRTQTGPNASFLQLDVFPGYVAADVSTGSETSGRAYKVGLDRQLHVAPLTLTGPGALAASIFRADQVNPATPQSLIDQLTRTHGVSLGSVSHVLATVNPATGKAGWSVYPADGATHYEASLSGSGLADPASAAITGARSAIAAIPQAARTAPHAAGGLAACLVAAAGDVQRIQACTQ